MAFTNLKLSKDNKTGYSLQESDNYFLLESSVEKLFNSNRNAKQANELKILQKIRKMLTDNAAIISEIPEFSAIMDQFSLLIDKAYSQYQDNKNSLINMIAQISDGLRNYGVMTDNDEIISVASIKKNNLYDLEDHELLERAFRIIQLARSYLSSLFLFGVQFNSLVEAENQANALSYITGLTGTDVFEETEWKRRIDEIYNETNCFVREKLDKLIENLKDQHPQLLKEYISAKLE
jgi:transcriptional regulator with PAS, ATPase and Fis domain